MPSPRSETVIHPDAARSTRSVEGNLRPSGRRERQSSTLAAIGRETKVATGHVSITAEVSIGKDGGGGFAIAVVLRVTLPENLKNEAGRKLVEQAHAACPYSKATSGNIPVELIVE
jgi:organic hydroperoxide reductase OsmC/OhrA